MGSAKQEMLLQAKGLRTHFTTHEGSFDAVAGVELGIAPNQAVGLVGETGSGKSVTALSILRLVPEPAGRITEGQVLFQGRDLLSLSDREMRRVRGGAISMVFQKPMSSLNPTFKIGTQMADIICLHQGVDHKEALQRGAALLASVRMSDPERILDRYPHELSGGMRQRVMIAVALSSNPALIIADEPTTALDVTIQKQILELIAQTRREHGFSMLFISHDLRTVYNTCDYIYVMYAGQIVEHGPVDEVFLRPRHPYVEALLSSLPLLAARQEMLNVIPDTVPSLLHPPSGCRFHPRCSYADNICRSRPPEMIEPSPGHWAACWRNQAEVAHA
ncbi:ABC transporter ATP-binding protein [Desulfoferula mesophila]|uniref:Peptide ABC transporter ATP-binding protein y4tR n=1 Tax=Desulfoferula mesophila TaxID=3058419 RepID=A0AAU9EFQ9_9BACT|nr:putative peptide ABC transporter ATP-binding protein y4tR [Desulfoferula mesophilus]